MDNNMQFFNLVVEHHIPTGLAALDISSEAYPSEAISLIDANFMWNEKPFEVGVYLIEKTRSIEGNKVC